MVIIISKVLHKKTAIQYFAFVFTLMKFNTVEKMFKIHEQILLNGANGFVGTGKTNVIVTVIFTKRFTALGDFIRTS